MIEKESMKQELIFNAAIALYAAHLGSPEEGGVFNHPFDDSVKNAIEIWKLVEKKIANTGII